MSTRKHGVWLLNPHSLRFKTMALVVVCTLAPIVLLSLHEWIEFLVVVAPLGCALAWWMGRRMVGPVEDLQREVLRRAQLALPRAELVLEREDEVGELARAFNVLLTALADRTRANEAFLADLAHEMKNPIAAIRAAAEILPTTDVQRSSALAEMIMTSTQRLDALVTSLLALARAEAGLPDEVREVIDLVPLLDGLVASTKADARYAAVTFQVISAAEGMRVAVAARFESALRNLIDNAVQFSGANGRVTIVLRREAGRAIFTIEDSGPGIPAQDLPRIFDRFFTTRATGSGLGLALARAIFEAHGGSLTASSPKGALFTGTLPLLR